MSFLTNTLRTAPKGLTASANGLRAEVRCLTSSAVSLAKKKVVDPTLPVAPRGPPTAYTLFFKDYIPSVLESHQLANGKTDMKALTTAAGQAWNALTSTAKEEFASAANEGKKAYEKAYKEFWDSTSPETRAAILKSTGKEVKPPGGKKAYKASIAARSGNPGKPLTSYFAFSKKIRDDGDLVIPENLQGQDRIRFIAQETGKRWKELSETEKQKYKDTYVQQKEAWEEWKKTQTDL